MEVEGQQLKKKKQLGEDSIHVSSSSKDYWRSRNRPRKFFDPYSVPAGWLYCPPYGDNIGLIIPSKVPLTESFNKNIPPGESYTPKEVIDKQRCLGREIGLVVDLTNTDRYYPESDWTTHGIRHVKIRCPGKDSVPDAESVDRFISEVVQFTSQESQASKYAVVHCTHGHNRTGYMIAHFLVRNQSVSVSEAIATFAQARPPGIYRQKYVEALYDFYFQSKPELFVCPQTPDWKRDSDQDNEVVAPFGNLARAGAVSDADFRGERIPFTEVQRMRNFCYQVLNLHARRNTQIPGSHPVSLDRDKLHLLSQQLYHVTWSAEVPRYMMLIDREGCYLVDPQFYFRKVPLRFPRKNIYQGRADIFHHCTLLDGELITETEPETQVKRTIYLIYDVIAINEFSVTERPFHHRLMLIEEEVIRPRNFERELLSTHVNPYYHYGLEPFEVRRKDLYLLSAASKLIKDIMPCLPHSADGLIFQAWNATYVPREHDGRLKWKYPGTNTVDFLFEVGVDGSTLLYLQEHDNKKLIEGCRVMFKDGTDDLSLYSGRIIECSWNSCEDAWIFVQIQTDKSNPDYISVYEEAKHNIEGNLTEDILLDEIDKVAGLPIYSDWANRHSGNFRNVWRRQ
ncbi:uncharacterized protein LOC129882838 isoform X2 [Solanum dulcamara]|uniref:uncharacterized protein LOC129882838 isoform X2 n=1 Tax=Solanum dulcamara TaxID=45834 RepID=UPI002484EE4C|nr:uncharacterized protein LOC129882838 isoform X2 [Solanum dulcamara]